MLKGKYVSLDLVRGASGEYIIRDNVGINIGRIFIIEFSKENRYCSFRIKFYKDSNLNYNLLKDALNTMIVSLFNNMSVFKINVISDENISVKAFVDLGFELEGILRDSIIDRGTYRSELNFGLNSDTFKSNSINRNLVLKGKDIELKVLTPESAEDILNYYINNRVYLNPFEPARDDSFYTLEVQRHSLIENYRGFLNGTSVNLGIYKETGLIGKIQLSNIVLGVFKNAFIGYSIDEKEQGKGYMKQALQLVLRYAFDEMKLHRVEASTLLDNIKSQAVLKSCGFKESGINEKYLFINGRWRDHKSFYIINSD